MSERKSLTNPKSKKLLVVTDTWEPQVNGVVRTLRSLISSLACMGVQVDTITPQQFFNVPHPTHPDIRLALNAWPKCGRMIERLKPEYIFIVTEGPLGMASRHYCLRKQLNFVTSFTTNFPKYLQSRLGIPEAWTFNWLRWFHAPAASVLVASRSMRRELKQRGFRNARLWTRGVDTELFRPRGESVFTDLKRPIWLYVGRIAQEKNLDAFLSMSIDGTKVVVGEGSALRRLRLKYPEAVFVGNKHGEELARHYSSGDVFVFPSKSETFGLVLLEALASGTPIAAYPVTGPMDIVTSSDVGVLHSDLRQAALGALSLSSVNCRRHAVKFKWEHCAEMLMQCIPSNDWH